MLSSEIPPEAGFQSYELFTNDSNKQKQPFLSDKVRNPNLTHPKLYDLKAIDRSIVTLINARRKLCAALADKPQYAEATASSLKFRCDEMEYAKLSARLEHMKHEGGAREDILEVSEQMRQLGHELYGKPDPHIRDMALNELWGMMDRKELHPSAQRLYGELNDGVVWNGQRLIPLPRAENTEVRLPRFEGNEALNWASEEIVAHNADIKALVYAYWEQAVEEQGDGYVCPPEDIVEVFQRVIDMRDPVHTSGVTVRMADGKTALSWESPEKAVLVGSRRKAIENPEELFCKVLHEFGVHGQRMINGSQTTLAVLGTGLFTNTPARPDYLTFEEGLATTVEEMGRESAPQWSAVKMGHYINITMAEAGADFRTVFENAWRYRILSKVEAYQPVTDEMIVKEKSAAYTACVRIFRGAHPDLAEATGVDIPPLSFNKDLAYLEGRVIAMQHLQDLYDNRDITGLKRLFAGKFDPTNPVQNELVKSIVDQVL